MESLLVLLEDTASIRDWLKSIAQPIQKLLGQNISMILKSGKEKLASSIDGHYLLISVHKNGLLVYLENQEGANAFEKALAKYDDIIRFKADAAKPLSGGAIQFKKSYLLTPAHSSSIDKPIEDN